MKMNDECCTNTVSQLALTRFSQENFIPSPLKVRVPARVHHLPMLSTELKGLLPSGYSHFNGQHFVPKEVIFRTLLFWLIF